MIRLGLCCIFKNQPIRFRRTTATYQIQFDHNRRLKNLSVLCRQNAESLFDALTFCHKNRIGDFRINSHILPLKTHPACGYEISDLPDFEDIIKAFKKCGRFCQKHNLRTTFHPDQFILLSSPDPGIIRRSVQDLIYQTEVAQWVGSDVINIHGGGAYGDKASALKRLGIEITKLPDSVRSRLTLENDDRIYTPTDLLPVCRDLEIPLVYDVHHHRCLNDGMNIAQATESALATWNREPLFHLSSPLHGWDSPKPGPHHDYIKTTDFPKNWMSLDLTVEVEAKAKELAVLKLRRQLMRKGVSIK